MSRSDPHRGRLLGTIIEPSGGHGPEKTAALTRTQCEGGIDFVKDAELQSDGPSCPFEMPADYAPVRPAPAPALEGGTP